LRRTFLFPFSIALFSVSGVLADALAQAGQSCAFADDLATVRGVSRVAQSFARRRRLRDANAPLVPMSSETTFC
jgi:hypothetical protein